MLFECGEAALLEPWQLDVSRLGGGQVFDELWQPCVSKLDGGQTSFLPVQKATFGSTGRRPEARLSFTAIAVVVVVWCNECNALSCRVLSSCGIS